VNTNRNDLFIVLEKKSSVLALYVSFLIRFCNCLSLKDIFQARLFCLALAKTFNLHLIAIF